MQNEARHSALCTLHFRGTSGYSPVFCRAVAADKSDALANFRQRIFPVAFVFDGKIASEALASLAIFPSNTKATGKIRWRKLANASDLSAATARQKTGE